MGDYVEAVQNQVLSGNINPRFYAIELVKQSSRPITLSMINGDSWKLATSERNKLMSCLSKLEAAKEEFSKLDLRMKEMDASNKKSKKSKAVE